MTFEAAARFWADPRLAVYIRLQPDFIDGSRWIQTSIVPKSTIFMVATRFWPA